MNTVHFSHFIYSYGSLRNDQNFDYPQMSSADKYRILLLCINFIHKCQDLQFQNHSEQEVFFKETQIFFFFFVPEIC